MPIDSPPHLQHPGYPRHIGDILENGTQAEQDALADWLHERLNFGVLREIAPLSMPEATPRDTRTVELAHFSTECQPVTGDRITES